MRLGLELSIFVFGDEKQEKADELGIEIPLEDCNLLLYTFFNIDCISISKDSRYSVILSGGDSFVCNESYEVVKQKIVMLNNLQLS